MKKLAGKNYVTSYTGKNVGNAERITRILRASPGQQALKRDIFKRLGYRMLFQDAYGHLVFKAVIKEWGSGKKGDPVIVRIERPDFIG